MGFAPPTAGVGMSSMRSRAEELGGELEVAPRPDGGTAVTASLPLAMGETEPLSTAHGAGVDGTDWPVARGDEA